jgi:anti-sigma factor RsiW
MTETLSCQELVELITEYLEGTLPAADRDRFDQHLSACGGCENYLEQMRRTITLTGRLTEADLPAETEADLMALFRGWKAGSPG